MSKGSSKRVLFAVVVMLFSGAVVHAQTNLWQDDGATVFTTAPVHVQGQGKVLAVSSSGSFSVGGAAPTGYPFFATRSAGAGLQLNSSYAGTASASFLANLGPYGTILSHNREPFAGGFANGAVSPNQNTAVHLMLGDVTYGRERLFSVASFPGGTETPWFVIKFDGKVGIGTTNPSERLDVAGNINVSGNINAKYQDVAEWVPATADLDAGTVVVLNPHRDNEVMASSRAYDTSVAGVVSAQPGLTLGEKSDTKETIATMGRVRVRVDARNAPIAIGDLLVTSDQPGIAMKSLPVEVGGMAMHRPGTIIGKALQPLAGGTGEILVLLSLQ